MMGLKVLLQFLSVLCLAAAASSQNASSDAYFFRNPGCGKRKLPVPPGASRIIGGRDAPEGAWPWQASIQFLGTHFCGGTIISSKWVVSAAHCYHNFIWHSSFLTVLVGITDLSKPGPQSQRRGVKNVIIHENYDFNSSNNDVALLMVKNPLEFTNYIQPCCIPMSMNHQVTLNLSNCFITGWGSINYKGRAVNVLQEAELELIETPRCNQRQWYNGLITENMLCAGMLTGGVDTCQGDSGSPLQCYSETDDKYYLIGVTSFGENCGNANRPGVYSKTSVYGRWLRDNQQNNRASPHRLFSSVILVLIFSALTLF